MRRSTRAAGNWMTAALVVAAVTGYLLVSGTLDPVLGGAITLAENAASHGQAKPKAATTLKASPVVDWQYFDNRPEWSSVRGVPQVSGPADPALPVRPAVAPPENPIHYQFSGPPPMPHYSLKPMTNCPQPRGPGLFVQHFLVSVTTGGATATWWDLGDPDTLKYQLAAVPTFIDVGNGTRTVVQIPTVRTTFAAPHTCQQMTASISGLVSGQSYEFVLGATNQSQVQSQTYELTRAQSGSELIP